MGNYLRDQPVRYLNLNVERLRELNGVLEELARRHNVAPPPAVVAGDMADTVRLSYVIRFDEKGYRLDNFEQVIAHLNSSKSTERIIFQLASDRSTYTNRLRGTAVDLQLYANDSSKCWLTVQCDHDQMWTEAAFGVINETLEKFGNRSYFVLNRWTPIVLQLLGVMGGFVLSLWSTEALSGYLKLDTSAASTIVFLATLVIFSNIWGFMMQPLLKGLAHVFPFIRFKDANSLHWIYQTAVGGIIGAIALFLVSDVFSGIHKLITAVLKSP